MKIVVDAFGGDNAPLSVIEGSALAVKEYGLDIVMTGNENIIKKVAQEHNISLDNIEIVHTEDVIEVCEEPTSIIKEHKNSSMGLALQLLADGKADAFVGAGSTGAVVVGATFIVKRIKGIKRAALAPIIPSKTGCYMIMDVGANLDCRPEMFKQWAIMGSIYMSKIIKTKSPRVALLNVGAEETKGRDLELGAYSLLQKSTLNFVGNIEPREVPMGGADVVVTDGFSGNIVLKLTEGMAKFLSGGIKDVFMSSIMGKIAGVMSLKGMKKFKKTMDYKEYGGAPLMGTAKPVIKAHGSSDGYAFKNAIRQAKQFVENNVIEEISKSLEENNK